MRFIEVWLHLFHPRRSNNHRPKLLHAESLLFFSVFAIGFVGLLSVGSQIWYKATGTVLGFATSISVDQVVAQTNQKRAEAGLAPLTFSGSLARAAQLKAEDMFSNQYWAHTSPQGKEPWDFIRMAGYSYQSAGENLARDFMGTGEMVEAWMNSPTHRANIVNSRYQEIGIAVVNGTLEGTETTLVVQMFGRPREAVAAVAPAAATQQPSTPRPTPRPTAVPVIQAVPSAAPSTKTETTSPAVPEVQAQAPVATPLSEVQSTQPVDVEQPSVQPAILSAMSLITGSIQPWPMVSPLQLTKAFFFSILILLITALSYDWVLVQRSPRARIVGRNLAHILFFTCIVFLLITFHSGAIR